MLCFVQVRGLRGLVQAPSAMESTTLLFAHGLDLFYTRLAPSRTFDLLPDDFPFALLVRGAGWATCCRCCLGARCG